MNRNQYLAFKKEISSFKEEDLIELAVALRALVVAFKRFGKVLNIPMLAAQIKQWELKDIIDFLIKYDSFDEESVLKLLKVVEQQIWEDYYIEIKAFPTILKEISKVVDESSHKHKIVDAQEVKLVGLKVKASERIYSRDLDRDLDKLLGKSL